MVLLASDGAHDGAAAVDSERVRILDAAERLFYARGLQLVGMDQVRTAAGVSLKRLYREFSSKDQLIEAYLVRRDARWLTSLRGAVARPDTATERILAAFDWLGVWFVEPGFRGCAFTNSFGELGAESSTVAAIAAAHKAEFRSVFVGLVSGLADEPGHTAAPELGVQLYLLAEGAITAAAVTGDPGTAHNARAAAATLLRAAQPRVDESGASQPGVREAPVSAACAAEPGRRPGFSLFRFLRRRR